ncbi:hypothetical protein HDU87_002375 [Geranomyces variabilis]|uniref:C3H1-type domain-containing protein n=1 Tax=Geranomyces variabilis TaxID=109894 RepID=A0AAD5TMN9_9FUNG|nr:hypothetical protein HDU87_002375 [Geranomyces variabilis]
MDDAANASLRVAAAAAAWGVQQEAMMAADEGTCDFWQRGTCRYGPSCWFSHDEQPHQQHPLPPTPAPQHRPSAFAKPLARIIPLALTPNGYMHTQQVQPSRYTTYASLATHTLPAQTASAPGTVSGAGGGNGNGGGGGGSGPVSTRSVCRYWLQGICNRGPACRFLHGAAAPAAGDGRHHHQHHHHHHHHHNTTTTTSSSSSSSNRQHHRTAHIQQQIHQQYHHHAQQQQQQHGLSTVLTVVRPSAPRPRPRSFDIRYLPTAAYATMLQPTADVGTQIEHVATAGVVLQQQQQQQQQLTTGRLRAYTYPPARFPATPVMDADGCCDGHDVNAVDGDDCGSLDDYGLPFDLDEWDDFAGGGGAAAAGGGAGIVDGIVRGCSATNGSALPRLRDLRSIWDDGGVAKAECKNVVASTVVAQPTCRNNVADGVWQSGSSSSLAIPATKINGTLQMFEKLAL